jgi:large subunit ribosomal protein L11
MSGKKYTDALKGFDREQFYTPTEADVAEIAQIKLPDLNAYDLEAAKQQVRGTARSMGIDVVA